MTVRILHGDCIEVMKTLPADSINCCVTSPPYWGLRDYGVDGQIGLEQTPWIWLEKMIEVFREVHRVLRGDGTIWVNLGDSYYGSGQGWGDTKTTNKGHSGSTERQKPVWDYAVLKPKDLMMMPARFAIALQEDGWYLRSDIIWAKPNPMPESALDRPTKSHEHLFLFSKSPQYYYDNEAIREECVQDEMANGFRGGSYTEGEPGKRKNTGNIRPAGWATGKDHSANGWATEQAQGRASWKGSTFDHGKTGEMQETRGHTKRSGNKERKPRTECGAPQNNTSNQAGSVPWQGTTRNKRDVWIIATTPFPEKHFATFPPKLIEPCILAGCAGGGIVLDPFFGAGTTGLVADRLQRNCIGIELNPKYIDIAERRLRKDAGLFGNVVTTMQEGNRMKLQFTTPTLSIQRESYPAVCAALHAIYVRRRAAWRDAHPQHDHKAQSERGEG